VPRDQFKRFSGVTNEGKHDTNCRNTLCAITVPMAKMAPSAVDILAAMIPIIHQPPKNGGAW